jgi:hypothetical protein
LGKENNTSQQEGKGNVEGFHDGLLGLLSVWFGTVTG